MNDVDGHYRHVKRHAAHEERRGAGVVARHESTEACSEVVEFFTGQKRLRAGRRFLLGAKSRCFQAPAEEDADNAI